MAKSPLAAAASGLAQGVPSGMSAGEVTAESCSPVARTMGWLPPSRSMSESLRCPSAMPLSRYCPSPSGPRWAITSHMAFRVGRSASVAPVNPQIPHMVDGTPRVVIVVFRALGGSAEMRRYLRKNQHVDIYVSFAHDRGKRTGAQASQPRPQIWFCGVRREARRCDVRVAAPRARRAGGVSRPICRSRFVQLFRLRLLLGGLFGVEYLLAAQVRGEHLRVLDVERFRLEDVLIHHDEVGRLALLEAARLAVEG